MMPPISIAASIGAIVSMVLAAFTLYLTFEIVHVYRIPDFTSVSAGPVVGSCIESVTPAQLKLSNYDSSGWVCKVHSKDALANLLAASVHSIVQLHAAEPFTDARHLRVVNSVISTTLGGSSDTLGRGEVYEVLSVLGTPVSADCETVYGGGMQKRLTPLDPMIACDEDLDVTATTASYTHANDSELYTHCMHQFSYAWSWPTTGTFGIPKYGIEATPWLLPVLGTNESTTPAQRAQILTATRFGFSCVVYIFYG
jgi:hypothetical protein